MYYHVAKRWVITSARAEYTQAVGMAGANGIGVDATLLTDPGGDSAFLQAQESNDLENWKDVGGAIPLSSDIRYSEAVVTGIAAAYVRLKGTTTTAAVVVEAGINTQDM